MRFLFHVKVVFSSTVDDVVVVVAVVVFCLFILLQTKQTACGPTRLAFETITTYCECEC